VCNVGADEVIAEGAFVNAADFLNGFLLRADVEHIGMQLHTATLQGFEGVVKQQDVLLFYQHYNKIEMIWRFEITILICVVN